MNFDDPAKDANGKEENKEEERKEEEVVSSGDSDAIYNIKKKKSVGKRAFNIEESDSDEEKEEDASQNKK